MDTPMGDKLAISKALRITTTDSPGLMRLRWRELTVSVRNIHGYSALSEGVDLSNATDATGLRCFTVLFYNHVALRLLNDRIRCRF